MRYAIAQKLRAQLSAATGSAVQIHFEGRLGYVLRVLTDTLDPDNRYPARINAFTDLSTAVEAKRLLHGLAAQRSAALPAQAQRSAEPTRTAESVLGPTGNAQRIPARPQRSPQTAPAPGSGLVPRPPPGAAAAAAPPAERSASSLSSARGRTQP
jgi:hypothetical protein